MEVKCQQFLLGFKNNFSSVVENAWNNKLWLIPQGDWGAEQRENNNYYRIPNVRCCLQIQLVTDNSYHLQFQCINYVGNKQGAYVDSVGQYTHQGGLTFDSISQQGSLDLVDKPFIKGRQAAAAYEVGHYFGLGHIGV